MINISTRSSWQWRHITNERLTVRVQSRVWGAGHVHGLTRRDRRPAQNGIPGSTAIVRYCNVIDKWRKQKLVKILHAQLAYFILNRRALKNWIIVGCMKSSLISLSVWYCFTYLKRPCFSRTIVGNVNTFDFRYERVMVRNVLFRRRVEKGTNLARFPGQP